MWSPPRDTSAWLSDALDAVVRRGSTPPCPQGQPVVYGPVSHGGTQEVSQPQVFDMSQGDTTSASGFESLNGGSGGLTSLMQGVGVSDVNQQAQSVPQLSDQGMPSACVGAAVPDMNMQNAVAFPGQNSMSGAGPQGTGTPACGAQVLAQSELGCPGVVVMPVGGNIPPPPPFPAPGVGGCFGGMSGMAGMQGMSGPPGMTGMQGMMPGMCAPPPGFVGTSFQNPSPVLSSPSSQVLENMVVLMQQQMQQMQQQNAMILGLVQQMQQNQQQSQAVQHVQAVSQSAASGAARGATGPSPGSGSQSGSQGSSGLAQSAFKNVDSKLIPSMPTCQPEKWTTRPQQILGFRAYLESLVSWLSTLAPMYATEVAHVMSGNPIADENTQPVVERSQRLYYILKQAFGSSSKIMTVFRLFESQHGYGACDGYALLRMLKEDFSIRTKAEGYYFRQLMVNYRVVKSHRTDAKEIVQNLEGELFLYDRLVQSIPDEAFRNELAFPESEKFRLLLLNVDDATRNYLQLHAGDTFFEAKQAAIRYYERTVLMGQDFSKVPSLSLSAFGSSSGQPKSGNQTSQKDMSQVVCWKCEKRGHYARDCKESGSRPSSKPPTPRSNSNQTGKGKGSGSSSKGGSTSHSAKGPGKDSKGKGKSSKGNKKGKQGKKGYRAADFGEEPQETEEEPESLHPSEYEYGLESEAEENQSVWSEHEGEVRLSSFLESTSGVACCESLARVEDVHTCVLAAFTPPHLNTQADMHVQNWSEESLRVLTESELLAGSLQKTSSCRDGPLQKRKIRNSFVCDFVTGRCSIANPTSDGVRSLESQMPVSPSQQSKPFCCLDLVAFVESPLETSAETSCSQEFRAESLDEGLEVRRSCDAEFVAKPVARHVHESKGLEVRRFVAESCEEALGKHVHESRGEQVHRFAAESCKELEPCANRPAENRAELGEQNVCELERSEVRRSLGEEVHRSVEDEVHETWNEVRRSEEVRRSCDEVRRSCDATVCTCSNLESRDLCTQELRHENESDFVKSSLHGCLERFVHESSKRRSSIQSVSRSIEAVEQSHGGLGCGFEAFQFWSPGCGVEKEMKAVRVEEFSKVIFFFCTLVIVFGKMVDKLDKLWNRLQALRCVLHLFCQEFHEFCQESFLPVLQNLLAFVCKSFPKSRKSWKEQHSCHVQFSKVGDMRGEVVHFGSDDSEVLGKHDGSSRVSGGPMCKVFFMSSVESPMDLSSWWLIDSGASRSVLSTSFVNKYEIVKERKLVPPLRFTTASGETMEIDREVFCKLPLSFYEHNVIVQRQVTVRALVAPVQHNLLSVYQMSRQGWTFLMRKELCSLSLGQMTYYPLIWASCPWIKCREESEAPSNPNAGKPKKTRTQDEMEIDSTLSLEAVVVSDYEEDWKSVGVEKSTTYKVQ